MKKKAFLSISIIFAVLISMSACNGNKAGKNESESHATNADTLLMDTPMSTGKGTDTIEQRLKEGEDGTGKASTDPRTRKQQ